MGARLAVTWVRCPPRSGSVRDRGKERKEGEPMQGGVSAAKKGCFCGVSTEMLTRTTVCQNRPPVLLGVACILSFAGKKIGENEASETCRILARSLNPILYGGLGWREGSFQFPVSHQSELIPRVNSFERPVVGISWLLLGMSEFPWVQTVWWKCGCSSL